MTGNIKTVLLLTLLSGLILVLGGMLGGRAGMIIALGLALLMNVGSYWYSDKLVLSMYKARQVSESDAPGLHAMVGELAHNAGIPKPRVYIVPNPSPNAFATGRSPDHAAVAVTDGILRALSPEELRGVIAHEIGHVKNRDILIQCIAAVMGTAIMFTASMMRFAAIFGGGRGDDEGGNPLALIALSILAPIAAMVIQMAISRSREYMADDTGARLSGDPLALASALERISQYAERAPMKQGSQATAHLFIVNPFSAKGIGSLFSTHPPVAERVRRLRSMAAGA